MGCKKKDCGIRKAVEEIDVPAPGHRDTPTLRKLSSHEEHMLVMRKLENQKDRLDEKIMSARKLDAALANAYCAIGVAYATIEEGKKEDDDEVPAE